MAPPRLESLLEGPTSVAIYGEAVITVINTEVTAEGLRLSVEANQKVRQLHPGKVIGITVVYPGIKLPGTEMRKASSEAMAQTRAYTSCAVRIFLGDGFWLSTVRSVLTAIELIAPYDLPRRTFSEIPAATQWAAKNIQESLAWADRLAVAIGNVGGTQGGAQSQQV
jgi:hypothetical protein